ncbi:MAG TPA: tetratricopeptide repeat protein [Burkholderiales bacterium]|jgi:Flp pilus assembly protein TadD|nr:tetratricopeptide repeat protein [Burkholderiales bacterium]
MSLLLQALQKAAKSREEIDGEPASEAAGTDQLALEPIASEQSLRDEMPPYSPTPAQAATVVQASRLPAFDPMGYARDHYMIVFLGAAVLVAIIYGSYVYIQISNPGLFRSRPVPIAGPLASAPPAPAAAALPAVTPSQAAAKVSGMPANTASASAVTATGSLPSSFEESKPTVRSAAAEMAPARATAPRPRRAAKSAAQTTVSSEPSTISLADPPVETVVIRTNEAKGISVRRQPATLEPVDPTLMQAYEALQQGDLAQARKLYEQVLLSEPRSVDALLGLGAIAWKEGRVEEAGQRYQKVLELEPRNPYAQAGLIAIIGGADPQASESRLRQLIAREPSAFLYFTLGNLYADQGQWPGAEQAYFQAYQLQPDNADYAFNLAVGLEHIGQLRPALDYYRKALDLSFRKGRANFDQNLVIQRVGQLSARVE